MGVSVWGWGCEREDLRGGEGAWWAVGRFDGVVRVGGCGGWGGGVVGEEKEPGERAGGWGCGKGSGGGRVVVSFYFRRIGLLGGWVEKFLLRTERMWVVESVLG